MELSRGKEFPLHWCFKNFDLHVIALFEPRISGIQADRTIRRIGLPNSYLVEATGFSGGIWLLWDDHWHIEILETTSQYIHCRIWDDMGMNFLFSVVYGHPAPTLRNRLWQQFMRIEEEGVLPQCCCAKLRESGRV